MTPNALQSVIEVAQIRGVYIITLLATLEFIIDIHYHVVTHTNNLVHVEVLMGLFSFVCRNNLIGVTTLMLRSLFSLTLWLFFLVVIFNNLKVDPLMIQLSPSCQVHIMPICSVWSSFCVDKQTITQIQIYAAKIYSHTDPLGLVFCNW